MCFTIVVIKQVQGSECCLTVQHRLGLQHDGTWKKLTNKLVVK